MNSVQGFFKGLSALPKGIGLIQSNKEIKKVATIPFVLCFILLGLSIYSAINCLPLVHTTVVSMSSGFLGGTMAWLAGAILSVLLLVFFFLSFMLFCNILLIPFNMLIAEKTLKHNSVKVYKADGLKSNIKFNVRMTVIGVKKTLICLVLTVFLFICSFIPIINIIAAFIGFLVFAFDFTDYAFELRGFDLSKRFKLFKDNFSVYCGFATVVGLTFLLPGLNFLLIPAFVVGASGIVSEMN